MEKLSIAIIAKNEEEMIAGALKSAKWAGEVIVVDTGSDDRTVEIAKRMKVKVFKYTKKGSYAQWRNFALKKAKGEWVFYLDADERVTPPLKREILEAIEETEQTAFAIPRKNIILGRAFRHGGFWPDYVKRLFRRSDLKKWQGALHEEPVFVGEMGHLKNSLTHIKHESFSEMVVKTNDWSEIEAKLMLDAAHPKMNIARFVSVMVREFWKRMILKLAFLDGAEGVMFAMYQVYSRFVSYAKLWEMQMKRDSSKI